MPANLSKNKIKKKFKCKVEKKLLNLFKMKSEWFTLHDVKYKFYYFNYTFHFHFNLLSLNILIFDYRKTNNFINLNVNLSLKTGNDENVFDYFRCCSRNSNQMAKTVVLETVFFWEMHMDSDSVL